MPTLHVRAKILAAMMERPEGRWTRKELAEATGLPKEAITKSATACVRNGLLTAHIGETHSSPIAYTLTHKGRQWGIAFSGG